MNNNAQNYAKTELAKNPQTSGLDQMLYQPQPQQPAQKPEANNAFMQRLQAMQAGQQGQQMQQNKDQAMINAMPANRQAMFKTRF